MSELRKGARIVAAMSGGVDSCVTAALLKREGYDVIGVTLQLYDSGIAAKKKGACCAGQDIYDARRGMISRRVTRAAKRRSLAFNATAK
jgi:tRNA U34 2-thiouridine synthase MnmA/TrmU